MYNVVIVEDNKDFKKIFYQVIEQVKFDKNIKINTSAFSKYNNDLKRLINNKDINHKIYILDIQLEDSIEGLEIARKIRKNDDKSYIVIITSFYNQYVEDAIKSKLCFLDFIDKTTDYKIQLYACLEYAIKMIDKNNIIVLKGRDINFRIATKDILYVHYNSIERQSHVVTTYDNINIKTYKLLTEILKQLDNRFKYSSKSCIVNTDNVNYIDKKNMVVVFEDKSICKHLSKHYFDNFK